MNNLFQIVPGKFLIVVRSEDPLTHGTSINLPGRVKNIVAKTSSNGLFHRVERQDFVPYLVSVDQNQIGITRRHPAGHRTLSRTDPSDNSENGNVRVI